VCRKLDSAVSIAAELAAEASDGGLFSGAIDLLRMASNLALRSFSICPSSSIVVGVFFA